MEGIPSMSGPNTLYFRLFPWLREWSLITGMVRGGGYKKGGGWRASEVFIPTKRVSENV